MADEQQRCFSFTKEGQVGIEIKEEHCGGLHGGGDTSNGLMVMESPPPSPDMSVVAGGGGKTRLKQGFRGFRAKLKNTFSAPMASTKNLVKQAFRAAKFSNTPRRLTDDGDHFSVLVGDHSVLQLTQMAASALSTGFEVSSSNNSTSGPQGDNDNEDPESVEVSHDESINNVSPENPAPALWVVSLATLSMDIATTLYKPARGVVFGHNKEAYYLTLAAIFASGVAEAVTAYWMSRSRDAHKRRFSFGRFVLFASIGPFVAIVGIGGFAFIEG